MASGERVAFLGLGIMGAPMAATLSRAGFELTVWNRTAERARSFAAEHDARAAATPAEAAREADVLITMVVDGPQVREVLCGESGALEGLAAGSLVIDMSTIAPDASVEIGELVRARGVGFLDAPVTGSRPKAEDGTLTIMVGGDERDFIRAEPVLVALGELIVHVGPQGHGSTVKLINNTLAATNAAALAEGLVLARAAGVDTAALRRVVGAGSGNSAIFALKAGPMLEHDFEPLFKLEHLLKDVRHCLAQARALGVDSSVAEAARLRYEKALEKGLGGEDFAAVMEVVERSSGKSCT